MGDINWTLIEYELLFYMQFIYDLQCEYGTSENLQTNIT